MVAPAPDFPDEQAEGYSAESQTLLATVETLRQQLAAQAALIEQLQAAAPSEELKPLKALLPTRIAYETARRAADAGELTAQKPFGRWLSTEANVAKWIARTGRG